MVLEVVFEAVLGPNIIFIFLDIFIVSSMMSSFGWTGGVGIGTDGFGLVWDAEDFSLLFLGVDVVGEEIVLVVVVDSDFNSVGCLRFGVVSENWVLCYQVEGEDRYIQQGCCVLELKKHEKKNEAKNDRTFFFSKSCRNGPE